MENFCVNEIENWWAGAKRAANGVEFATNISATHSACKYIELIMILLF